VRRVDDAYGDRNLICTCAPIEAYTDEFSVDADTLKKRTVTAIKTAEKILKINTTGGGVKPRLKINQ
jgi:hypothetical protein